MKCQAGAGSAILCVVKWGIRHDCCCTVTAEWKRNRQRWKCRKDRVRRSQGGLESRAPAPRTNTCQKTGHAATPRHNSCRKHKTVPTNSTAPPTRATTLAPHPYTTHMEDRCPGATVPSGGCCPRRGPPAVSSCNMENIDWPIGMWARKRQMVHADLHPCISFVIEHTWRTSAGQQQHQQQHLLSPCKGPPRYPVRGP
jgi:hypothetical protein